MKIRFEQYIHQHQLFSKNDCILVAVSGGIDSTVLLHLLHELNYDCVVAHCNFNLRNEESDGDEQFVKDLAEKYKFFFVSESFDTSGYAEKKGISIQMAARELRYNFFERVRKENHCKVIATAHHADDNIETFFINLIRGTGIKGLSGIPVKTGNIVRPLLFATRNEIEIYAKSQKIKWRNDSSNLLNKYTRNKLRNQVLPLFDEIKPEFRNILKRNIEHFHDTHSLLKELLKDKLNKIVSQKKDNIFVSIEEIKSIESGKTILYEIISNYGFNPKQNENIWQSLNSESGKMFFSKNYSLNKDREHIIISPIEEKNNEKKFYIDDSTEWISEPFEMSIEKVKWNDDDEISHDPNILFIDSSLVEFPLIIRRWIPGDFFQPFGMKGFKKLSDFFIDQKISKTEKENTWILESSNRIVWLIGQRLDDRFKITKNTKEIYKLHLH